MSQDYESALSESWKIYATAFEIIGEEPNEAFKWVFKRAYQLGKQEKDADTMIQGWVAIDEGADCPRFYNHKPFRKKDGFKDGLWSYGMEIGLKLDPTLFPDLTWDDDPIEVELIIKRKKK